VDRLLDRDRQQGMRFGKLRLAMAVGLVAALAGVATRLPGAIALAMPLAESVLPAPAVQQPPAPAAPAPAPIPSEPAVTPAEPTPSQPATSTQPSPVIVNVTVQDQANRSVPDLTQFDFQIFEDGIQQQISEFSVKNRARSVGIVLDASGSMRDKRDLVDLAVMQLLKSANPQDEFFPVTFNDEVQVGAMMTSASMQLANSWYPDQPRGGTALRDAIYAAAQRMTQAHNPTKILLILSDGVDNASTISSTELQNAVLAAKVEIEAITFASPGTDPGRGSRWLRDLVQQTGGREFVTDDPSAVRDAASLAIPTQYQIKYQSTNTARDGSFRSIRVKLLSPGMQQFKVRTRSGYFADKQW